MKKLTWGIVAIVVILLIIGTVFGEKGGDSVVEGETFKVGAILPLSGGTAFFGEAMKVGFEYAKEDLGDKASNVEIIFEDSEGLPATGVSSYNKLVNIDSVDVLISALSRISVPLVDRAATDEVPLILTLVSSMNAISADNPWVYRIFQNAELVGNNHFPVYEDLRIKKLGLISVNDEYGKSVTEFIEKKSGEVGIELIKEFYLPGDYDYRTQIIKMKEENVEGLSFIGIPPAALANFLTQADELSIDLPIFDIAGVLQSSGAIGVVGELSEDVYTGATPFDLGDKGTEIFDRYMDEHGNAPQYAVPFAYDAFVLIAEASENGKYRGEEFLERINKMKSFDGVSSEFTFSGTGEIAPELYPAQIIRGKLIQVK